MLPSSVEKVPIPPRSNTPRILEIDSLRGIAALVVLCSHYFGFEDFITHRHHWFDFISGFGSYGVHLFFIISGFVILMTLAQCRRAEDFLISRLSRIFPAYWLAILITSGFLWWLRPRPGPGLAQIALNFTMTDKFFGFAHVDSVYWTLNVELSFYLWMLLVFSLNSLNRIERIIPFVLAFQLAVGIYCRWSGHQFSQGTKVIFQLEYAHLFCAGMLFFLVWRGRMTSVRLALLLGCLINEAAVPLRNFAWIPNTNWGTPVVAFFFVVMMLVVRGKLRALVHPIFLFFGGISYSLYLLHDEIGRAILDTMRAHGHSDGIALIVALVVVFTLAALLRNGVEKPMMAAIRIRYLSWRKRADSNGREPSVNDFRAPVESRDIVR